MVLVIAEAGESLPRDLKQFCQWVHLGAPDCQPRPNGRPDGSFAHDAESEHKEKYPKTLREGLMTRDSYVQIEDSLFQTKIVFFGYWALIFQPCACRLTDAHQSDRNITDY